MVQLETNRLPNCLYFKLDAFVLLDAADDFEQVSSVGIASRPEHSHEALGRLVGKGAKLLEPHGGVDVVTQHDLARIDIPGKQTFDAFLQQSFSKCRVALARACTVSLKSTGERHVSYLLLLATSVLSPEFAGILDFPLLARLGATAKQDYQGVSVSAEIYPVPWANIDTVLQHTAANTSHIRQVASLHVG